MPARLIKPYKPLAESGFLSGIDRLNYSYLKNILKSITLHIILKALPSKIETAKNDFIQKPDLLDVLRERPDIKTDLNDQEIRLVYSLENYNSKPSFYNRILRELFGQAIKPQIILSDEVLDLVLLILWEIKFINYDDKIIRLLRTYWNKEDLKFLLISEKPKTEGFYPAIVFNRRREFVRSKGQNLRKALSRLICFLKAIKLREKRSIRVLTQLLAVIESALHRRVRHGL